MTYETGTVGDAVVEEVRNNDRVILDDERLAAELFARSKPFLPATLEGDVLVGFNERLRFYRYAPGQTFKPHRDGAYLRIKQREESWLTFMVYLNDDLVGGQTNFFSDMRQAFGRQPFLSVAPKRGMALVFVHDVWHEGAPVIRGRKYVLRTDVMYGRRRRVKPDSVSREAQQPGPPE